MESANLVYFRYIRWMVFAPVIAKVAASCQAGPSSDQALLCLLLFVHIRASDIAFTSQDALYSRSLSSEYIVQLRLYTDTRRIMHCVDQVKVSSHTR